jgi:hypothetical protein
MEESIFVDAELQGFDDDEDDLLHPSISSLELFPSSTLEPLSQQQLRRHGLRGRSFPSRLLPLMFRRHIHLNKS